MKRVNINHHCCGLREVSEQSIYTKLNMEAILSSETSVHTRSTRRHIPEGGILQVEDDPTIGYLYRVEVGSIADVSEVHAVSFFGVEVNKISNLPY
jgi:hypothetical protein